MSRSSNYHGGRARSHCYFCGAFGGIEEHHVIPQRFGGPDKPANVVSLCSSCHDKLERLYDKSFYEWFGIDDEEGQRRYHTICPREDCTNLVTEHWRNRHSNLDLYACEEHVTETWREREKFEHVATVEVDR